MIKSLRLQGKAAALAAGGFIVVAMAACAPTNTGGTYSNQQLGSTSSVENGRIVSMREVNVAGRNSGVGTIAGAGAGAVAGSALGKNTRTNILGGIGGAVLGGIIGTGVEDIATRGKAVEFVVERADGSTFAVVQTNEDNLQPGERVLIVSGDRTRLARDNSNYSPPQRASSGGGYSTGGGYPSQGGSVTTAPPGSMSGR